MNSSTFYNANEEHVIHVYKQSLLCSIIIPYLYN